MPHNVLIVDDDPLVLRAIARMLGEGFDVDTAGSGAEALERTAVTSPDLLIIDVRLGDMSGLDVLETLRASGRSVPSIVMSGDGTVEAAVRAVRLGAFDFIEKPVRIERLKTTVENCFRFQQLHAVNDLLRAELGQDGQKLLGDSPAMAELRALVEKVAPTEGRVLILGENGTGKELIAEAIHRGSPRAHGPFVKVNCSAIPKDLVESELFGHEKGAFTGAIGARKGRFELADRGTLFLDEIGDMPDLMQVKLLRVLQEGTFERVGGTRTLRVDVRVLAATNRDIGAMVREGSFREDLYYRLNVITVRPPPLRDRDGDVPILANLFLASTAARNRRPSLALTPGAMALLASYSFPGNVRELQNLIERLGILADGESITEADVLRALPELRGAQAGRDEGVVHGDAVPTAAYVPGRRLLDLVRDAERDIIVGAIEAHAGNKAAAARSLGVERAHFYKKCKALGVSTGDD